MCRLYFTYAGVLNQPWRYWFWKLQTFSWQSVQKIYHDRNWMLEWCFTSQSHIWACMTNTHQRCIGTLGTLRESRGMWHFVERFESIRPHWVWKPKNCTVSTSTIPTTCAASVTPRESITLQWRHMSVMASQMTNILTLCSTACSGKQQRNDRSSRSMALWKGTPPVTDGFP